MNGFYIEGYDLQVFPIGDLAHMCNVTRKMILNYEDHGLLYPVRVEKNPGTDIMMQPLRQESGIYWRFRKSDFL